MTAGISKYRDRQDLSLEDLAAAARRLLTDVRQTRYKVTPRPDVRTLRFYMTEGILDGPLSYEKGAARFGYRHLLQVAAIKRLQAQYLPLKKIKEILAGMDTAQLEGVVAEPVGRRQAGLATAPGSQVAPALLMAILDRPRPTPTRPAAWTRHELVPGIEVHVRTDFDSAACKPEELAQRFEALMRRLKGERIEPNQSNEAGL